MCVRKKLLVVLTLLITLSVLLMPSVACYAQFYDNYYPDNYGIESGYFMILSTSYGEICLSLPRSSYDVLILTSAGQIFNNSNSILYCSAFYRGTVYRARFNARDTLEISGFNGNQSTVWSRITIQNIDDTNFDFFMINPDNEYANNNLYFDKFQIAVLGLLVAILFFGVMRWYLLHQH